MLIINLKKMKKFALLFAAGAFVASSLTSCEKEYTCNCAWSDGTGEISYTFEAKKKDAEAACGDYETTINGETYSCELE